LYGFHSWPGLRAVIGRLARQRKRDVHRRGAEPRPSTRLLALVPDLRGPLGLAELTELEG